jgi:hypothetical protein
MATIALGFNISASATGMAQGVNAAAVELEKLGLAAKKTAGDVGVLKTLSIGQAFVNGVQSVYSTFSGFAQGAFDAVESTSNLSRELGVSYSQLQELQLAADLAGVSTESLGKAFTKAQVTIVKASQGGKEAVAALSSIGLNAADFQGLSSSEQFTLIANAINNIADPAQRAAAAVSIFGKSGTELLPVFRELGGNLQTSQDFLSKFGGGLSALDVSQINQLGDTFQLAGKAIEIVGQQILAQLAPALTQAAEQFINFAASLDIEQIASTATSVIKAFGGALTLAYTVASLLSPVFDAIGSAIEFLASNAKGAAAGIGLAVTAMAAYQVYCGIAAIATGGFAAAVRALLASSGIGLIAVVVGAAGGALLEWGLSAQQAGGKAENASKASAKAAQQAAVSAQAVAQAAAGAIGSTFDAAKGAAQQAAEEAKKASDAARKEADASIQRLTVEQQFGGDNQRFAAAQAVQAIEQDIRRTEEEIAAAREAGNQDALDAGTQRLAQLDQAMAREKDIASGAAKAAKERAKLEAEYAKLREAFDEKRLAALAKPSTELLQLEDTRTASGYAALQRFSQDQSDDPAVQEYRKQLKELQKIRQEIAKTADQVGTVDILGA